MTRFHAGRYRDVFHVLPTIEFFRGSGLRHTKFAWGFWHLNMILVERHGR